MNTVPEKSLVSWLSGTEDQSAQDAHLAEQQALFNQRLQAREDAGTIDPTLDTQLHDYSNSLADDSENTAYGQGFAEGAAEGWNNVLNAPGKVVGAVGSGLSQTLWGVLKNIPWWIYLGGVLALFVWMGGVELLSGYIGGKLGKR
jgi:hypothetical protein